MNFQKLNGLVPAVIQDYRTNKVLMLGFMNSEAIEKTKNDGLVTFYSRSKKRLWTKGEESGNYLRVISIIEDCDNDTLLIKVLPKGPVCHKGSDTCFNEKNNLDILFKLTEIIEQRKNDLPENSYTAKLFKSGINKIAQKVGEEAIETIIEAKDNNNELFLNESADLIFHLLVLLAAKGLSLHDVMNILEKRYK